eukprot:TRINITY_DN13505_c0_g1_i1.p1 TRINITY_DN13505_c0_g1~~TRINITY_DN13505_c0_g1_i1.p1  ORF type:complete len:272 (+),score=76.36 TRINITY_DN13505_c0_g1_i1:78-818(+)
MRGAALCLVLLLPAAAGLRLPPSPCGAACGCPWTAPCRAADGGCVGRTDLNWTVCPAAATDCHPGCECPQPSYFRLDLEYMLLPTALLFAASVALVPPAVPKVSVPIPKTGASVSVNVYSALGLAFMVVSSAVAFLFSTLWDNIIASHGVWTYNSQCMVGVYKSIPYEEYAWFLLHTCLGLSILQLFFAAHLRYGAPLAPPPALPRRWRDPRTIFPCAALRRARRGAWSCSGAARPTTTCCTSAFC